MSSRKKSKHTQKNIRNKVPKVITRPKSEHTTRQNTNTESNLRYSAYQMLNIVDGLKTQSTQSKGAKRDMRDLMESIAFIEHYTFKNVYLYENNVQFTYNSIIKNSEIKTKIEFIGDNTYIKSTIDKQVTLSLLSKHMEQQSEQQSENLSNIILHCISSIVDKTDFCIYLDTKTESIVIKEKIYNRYNDQDPTTTIFRILYDIIYVTDNLIISLDTYGTDNYYWLEYAGYNHLGKYVKETCLCTEENGYSIYRDNYIDCLPTDNSTIVNISQNVITALKAVNEITTQSGNIKLILEKDNIRLYQENSGELYVNGIEVDYSTFEIDTEIGTIDQETTNYIIPIETGSAEYNNFTLVEFVRT